MKAPEADPRVAAMRNLMIRWAVLLVALTIFAWWAACRLNRAATSLQQAAAHASGGGLEQPVVEYWTCLMHPEVMMPEKDECPKCGMGLSPKYAGSDEPGVKPKATASRPAKVIYMCTMPECNDQPSDDPDSRCPVCGMKRERIVQDVATDGDDHYEIALSERARRLAELMTEPVAYRALHKQIRAVGKVTYDETRHKMVTAWIGGRIEKLFADYTGMVVYKGDHLVEIYSPDLVDAQAGLLSAVSSYEKLKDSTLDEARRRGQRMIVAAERKLELFGITREQIEYIKKSPEAATNLTIYAPLGGTIVSKSAMEGMAVKTGDLLYEIADLTHVWLLLELYESDLPWIRPFQDVRVTTESLPGEEFRGRIVFVDPVVDRMTRTIKVRVNVPNPDLRLKPEMFVNAKIEAELAADASAATPAAGGKYACRMHPWETDDELGTCSICLMNMVPVEEIPQYRAPSEGGRVLCVPREAVLTTGERSLVYVELEPGTYRSTEVRVGPLATDESGRQFYPILSGLKEGTLVVTRGNFAIDSQMQLSRKRSLFSQDLAERDNEALPAPEQISETTPVEETASTTIAQTHCPVMESKIDLEVFTDFRDVRVYFCCPMCINIFQKNPEKYIPKLPPAVRNKLVASESNEQDQHDG